MDVSSACDVFLQNIVLYRSREFFEVCSLLPGHGDIQGQKNRRRGIDGHGSGYSRQRNLFKKRLHVLERADGHAHFAHFAPRPGMVGIKTHLRGQIEGDGQARLALRQEVAVARVRLASRAEAGILPHGPELAAIHGGIDSACVGKLPR